MDEKIFLNHENVSVSNSRFIVNGQTYAMSNVTSVKSGVNMPKRGGSILLILIGLLLFLFGLGNGWVFGLGCILTVLGIADWAREKTKYSVILNTSAGENQALVSEDKNYIENVVAALNNAIVSRG